MSLKRSNRLKLILFGITLAAICAFIYYKQSLTNQLSQKQALKIQLPVHIETSAPASPERPSPPESKASFKLIDLSPADASEDEPKTSEVEVTEFEKQIDLLVEMLRDKVILDSFDLTAIEIFISRLPDNLSSEELNMLGKYLNAYQETHSQTSNQLNAPEHIGNAEHNLGMIVTRLYSLKRQENHLHESADPPADIEQTQVLNKQIEQSQIAALDEDLKHQIYPEDQQAQKELSTDKPADQINRLRTEEMPEEQIRMQNDERFDQQSSQKLDRLQSFEATWMARYLKFLEDKQLIMDAGLAEEDKASQIDQLFRKHYSEQEQEAAMAFDKLVDTPENARPEAHNTR